MPTFSAQSLAKLATADQRLQDIFHKVVQVFDCAILCGERNQADQDAAVASGKSKTPWPTSKHNRSPSLAVDAAPYPIIWSDVDGFRKLNEIVQQEAAKLGHAVKWGGDFVHLRDYDHWELAE